MLIALISGISFHLVVSQTKVKNIRFDYSKAHDSLVYKALALSNDTRLRFNIPDNYKSEKCGLSLQVEYLKRKNSLSQSDRVVLDQVFSRDIMDTSILSKKNNFRIHYNKSGSDAPNMTDKDKNGVPDFVDSVAYYFEFCLDKIVNVLGCEGLVPDSNQGGGNEFDVYIKDLSSGTYGYTSYEDNIEVVNTVPKYTSYITIDNNFNDLYTSGIDGMKITAGHELFHAIQLGRYGLWGDDVYYYEILSSWMETYLFPDVKDYYQFLPTYFTTTTRPPWKHSGYDLTLWGLFLSQKYSPDVIKNILEGFKNYMPLMATEKALNNIGSNFANEFADFSNWVFFTSYRSKNGFYFKNAAEYPSVSGSSLKLVNFMSPTLTLNSYLIAFTNQYYSIRYGNDTISIISSRANLNEAYDKTDTYGSSSFKISDNSSESMNINLANGLKALFITDNPQDWKNFYLINNNYVMNSSDIKVYPNPLIANESSRLNFNIPASIGSEVQLFIFSNDLRLIYEGKQLIKPILGGNGINWNCKDSNEKSISSGIYFYFVKTENKEWKNKFAVVRKK